MERSTYGAALDRVLELAVLVNEDMEHGLTRLGLTPSRAHLLWELEHRGPCTQRALADALKVSPRNVTGLVDALVDTGFVARRPHPTDRRATLVSFTAHGAKTARDMVTGHEEFADLLFAGMAEEQFSCLVDGLQEISLRLRTHLEAGAGAGAGGGERRA